MTTRLEVWHTLQEILNKDVKINIDVAKQLLAGTEKGWSTRRCLIDSEQELAGQKSIRGSGAIPMTQTCDCSETQIIEHLLVCQLLDEPCTTEDLARATDWAIIMCVQRWKNL